MSSMLDWALYYQKMGLSVIPVSGKTPLILWKEYQKRCASEEEIKQWWQQFPNAEIGVCTGLVSNRLVLDIDGPEAEQMVGQYFMPPTYAVKTKKGAQYHFAYPKGFTGKTTLVGLFNQIDTRGEKGYCKMPPSQFSDGSGRYEQMGDLDCLSLAGAPSWLVQRLLEVNKLRQIEREAGESWLKEKLDSLRPGNRNQTMASIAGRLRNDGWSSEDMFLWLQPYADNAGLGSEELKTICESVGQYAPRTEVSSDEIIAPSKMLAEKPTVSWLVTPKIISANSLSFIVGLPKACKSWVLMDLALALATGTEWIGKFACKKSRVIYLDQERAKESTIERFNRLIGGRGINAEDLDDNLLIRPQSRTKIDLPQSYEAFDRLLTKFKPDIVLVDSLKKFHSKNELATQDMQTIFTKLDELKDKHNCSVVFIHHEPKGVLAKRKEAFEVTLFDAAGTVDLQQSADHFFNILAYTEKHTSMFYHTGNNHGELVEPFKFSVVDTDSGIEVKGS